jgi:hypothetical protein
MLSGVRYSNAAMDCESHQLLDRAQSTISYDHIFHDRRNSIKIRTTLSSQFLISGAGQQPRTSGPPLGTLTFLDPQSQQAFASYRLALAQQDIPQLQPGMRHNSVIMIAQGISTLTKEQRLTQQEAQQSREDRDAPKTAGDYFRVLLPHLMRWCQVATETDLPAIYEILANTKKGNIWSTLQTAVEEVLTNRHYLEDFPLSPTLANKIIDLK